MQDKFDLLIIGGGPAGASLACALAPTGWRIGLVEASAAVAYNPTNLGVRTLALAYGSCRVYQTMGIWEDILQQAKWPIARIEVTDRGHIGQAHLSAHELAVPALGYVVPMPLLTQVLYRHIANYKNITVYRPGELTAINISAERTEAVLKADKKKIQCSAQLLVGADGAYSAVRKLLKIETMQKEYPQKALVSTVESEKPHNNTAYERFMENGPLALLPMAGNRMALVWTMPAEDATSVGQQNDAEFLRLLQKTFGYRLGQFSGLSERRVFPLSLTKVEQTAQHRAVLVGNAAHSVHPVAGQGFNLGLRDIAVLADALVDAKQQGKDIGDIAVLQHYERSRRRDNFVIRNFTDGLIRVFGRNRAPLTWARNFCLMAVDNLPPLKRQLLRVTSGLAGRQPRLARGLPLQRR